MSSVVETNTLFSFRFYNVLLLSKFDAKIFFPHFIVFDFGFLNLFYFVFFFF